MGDERIVSETKLSFRVSFGKLWYLRKSEENLLAAGERDWSKNDPKNAAGLKSVWKCCSTFASLCTDTRKKRDRKKERN